MKHSAEARPATEPAPDRERVSRVGVRATRQRRALEEALASNRAFRSAQDLHAGMRAAGDSVGLTTVYRTLQTLADAGVVDVLHAPGGETLFRLCSDTHHHHLVCRSCGETAEIQGTAVERWAAEVAREHGFTEVEHTVEITGLCADCAAGADSAPEAGAGD